MATPERRNFFYNIAYAINVAYFIPRLLIQSSNVPAQDLVPGFSRSFDLGANNSMVVDRRELEATRVFASCPYVPPWQLHCGGQNLLFSSVIRLLY